MKGIIEIGDVRAGLKNRHEGSSHSSKSLVVRSESARTPPPSVIFQPSEPLFFEKACLLANRKLLIAQKSCVGMGRVERVGAVNIRKCPARQTSRLSQRINRTARHPAANTAAPDSRINETMLTTRAAYQTNRLPKRDSSRLGKNQIVSGVAIYVRLPMVDRCAKDSFKCETTRPTVMSLNANPSLNKGWIMLTQLTPIMFLKR